MTIIAHERYRGKVTDKSSGLAYFSTGVPISGSGTRHNYKSEECWDWVRPKSDHKIYPLEILNYEEKGGLLNKDGTQGNHSVFQNYVPAVYTWGNFPHHSDGSMPGNPSDTQVAVNAASRTNPSRPYVDVPNLVFELGDIAQLLKDSGKNLLKKGAHYNLSYQFGIAPIVSDFVKLLNFAEMLQKRMEEIKRLTSDRGLRRTTEHGTYSASGVYTKTLQSQGVFRSGAFFANTKQVVRAHCRWLPSITFQHLAAKDVEWLVKRAMHGLEFNLHTVWESLPWTWMIDYFSSVGQYLKTKRNIIPCYLDGVAVMRHTTTQYEFAGYKEADFEFDRSTVLRESKSRKRVVVAAEAHVPFLTANQLGILASLLITRNGSYR